MLIILSNKNKTKAEIVLNVKIIILSVGFVVRS